MAEETRLIIEHKDGRRYSVTKDGFSDLGYKGEGFKIVGPDGDAPAVTNEPSEAKAEDAKAK